MWNRSWSLVVTIGCGLAAFAVSWMVWPAMPDPMPIHWGANGLANGFAPKGIGLMLLPAMAMVFPILLRLMARKESDRTKALFGWTLAAIGGFLLLVHGLVVRASLTAGHALSMGAMFGLIGLLFVVLGGLMPLTEPNRVMGYRLRCTMNDPEIWRKTHKFAAITMVISGLAVILTGALIPGPTGVVVSMIVLFAGTLPPIFYAKSL